MSQPNNPNYPALIGAVAALLAIIAFVTGKSNLGQYYKTEPVVPAAGASTIVPNSSTPPAPVSTPAPTLPVTPIPAPVTPIPVVDRMDEMKAEVRAAIETADAVEIRALATLDDNAMATAYSGEALRFELEALNHLRMNGVHARNALLSRTYDDTQIDADGKGAKVVMTEHWNTTLYNNSSGEVVSTDPDKASPQTLHLRKEDQGWMITVIEF